MSSKATLALFIYGIIMHYSVNSSPVGLSFPSLRYVCSYTSLSFTFQSLICRSCAAPGGHRAPAGHRLTSLSALELVMSGSIIADWITG